MAYHHASILFLEYIHGGNISETSELARTSRARALDMDMDVKNVPPQTAVSCSGQDTRERQHLSWYQCETHHSDLHVNV